MIPLRRTVATLSAVTVLGLLAGCSEEPAASPPPRPTSTTASSSPTETTPAPVATKDLPPPELDELSRTFTVDGASAFAAYYIRVLNHVRSTGDPRLLQSISESGCSGCQYQVHEVDEYRVRGYSSPGFDIQFTGTNVDSWNPETGEIGLTVLTNKPALKTFDRNGVVIGSAPAVPEDEFWIDLNWTGTRWVVWEVE